MDRESLRRLRAQPGYLRFVSAATLARVSDEMFSVGVVLLVLDRTGSAALAGATVAAITLPSLVTGPLLGAWLDLTGRRRVLMVADQLLITAVLLAVVLMVGNAPDWTIPLVVLAAGLTYPLSFGGFTSLIPVIVPDELLAPANALETTSFNSALVIGPALAGGPVRGVRPGDAAAGGGRAGAVRAGSDRADPGARQRSPARRPRDPPRRGGRRPAPDRLGP